MAVVGVHVEFRLQRHLSHRLPCIFHAGGRTDIMLGSLSGFQTVLRSFHPRRVHDVDHLVRDRRDGDRESFHGLVVNTERGIETEGRERTRFQFHRVGFIGRQEACLEFGGERSKEFGHDPEVRFRIEPQQVVGRVDLMQAVGRDRRSADAPFARVLPCKPLGNITDLPFGDAESGERR